MQDILINKVFPRRKHSNPAPCFTLEPSSVVYIPVLGRVPCGPPKEAITNEDKCFPLPESILDNGNYYVLEASGDSMVGIGIDDGDYILVKQKNTASEGDIIVAMIDGDTTIKRIHYDNDNRKYVLRPENPKYSSMTYDYLDIQGVVVKVIKDI